MIDFFKRLDKFMSYNGLNDNRITIECGISNGLIGKARQRGSLSQENISRILLRYENLDANWLLTGNGAMINENFLFNRYKKCLTIIPIENMINFKKSIVVDDEDDQENNRFLSSSLGVADFLIEITDKTNTQKYAAGDFLACKKVDLQDVLFQWNSVCVLDTSFGIWIKKIMKGKDDNHYLILSENQNYDPFEIRTSEINAVALVLGVVKVE